MSFCNAWPATAPAPTFSSASTFCHNVLIVVVACLSHHPDSWGQQHSCRLALDVHFVSPAPVERHARVGGHPVPMALVSWIPAFAGMTRGHKNWQCIYEMDI